MGYGGTWAVSVPPSLHGHVWGIRSWLQANLMNFRSSSCEKPSSVLQKNWICVSDSMRPTWYIVWTYKDRDNWIGVSDSMRLNWYILWTYKDRDNWICVSDSMRPNWYIVWTYKDRDKWICVSDSMRPTWYIVWTYKDRDKWICVSDSMRPTWYIVWTYKDRDKWICVSDSMRPTWYIVWTYYNIDWDWRRSMTVNTVKCHYNANASLTRSILGSQTAPTSWHALMTVSKLLSTWAKGVKSSRPDRPQRQWHPFVSIQME